MSEVIVKKGNRKTAKAVFHVKNTGKLTINNKSVSEYFTDVYLSEKIQNIINEYQLNSSKNIEGFLNVYGGGLSAQMVAVCDALNRFMGKKVRTDTRRRYRCQPGLKGPRQSPPRNKR